MSGERLPYFDGSINKEALREGVSSALDQNYTDLSAHSKIPSFRETISYALSAFSVPERRVIAASFRGILSRISNVDAWNKDNYQTEDVFETRIKEKAVEIAEKKPYEEERNNLDANYFEALGSRYDQALAARDSWDIYANNVLNIQPISSGAKEQAAASLSDRIKVHGGQMITKDGREKLVEDGIFTELEITASLRSGLVEYADAEATYHKDGFKTHEEWDKAVYETAAGVIEYGWLEEVKRLASLNPESEIETKARDYYEIRLNYTEPTPLVDSEEEPIDANAEGDKLEIARNSLLDVLKQRASQPEPVVITSTPAPEPPMIVAVAKPAKRSRNPINGISDKIGSYIKRAENWLNRVRPAIEKAENGKSKSTSKSKKTA